MSASCRVGRAACTGRPGRFQTPTRVRTARSVRSAGASTPSRAARPVRTARERSAPRPPGRASAVRKLFVASAISCRSRRPRGAAPAGSGPPHRDADGLGDMGGQLPGEGFPAGAGHRDDLEVEVGHSADELVAPDAHAAVAVRIGAFGEQGDQGRAGSRRAMGSAMWNCSPGAREGRGASPAGRAGARRTRGPGAGTAPRDRGADCRQPVTPYGTCLRTPVGQRQPRRDAWTGAAFTVRAAVSVAPGRVSVTPVLEQLRLGPAGDRTRVRGCRTRRCRGAVLPGAGGHGGGDVDPVGRLDGDGVADAVRGDLAVRDARCSRRRGAAVRRRCRAGAG